MTEVTTITLQTPITFKADKFDGGGEKTISSVDVPQRIKAKHLRAMDAQKGEVGKALALNPDYAEAHFNLATAYFLEDHLEQALAHYRRAVELDADNPIWLQHLSRALRKKVVLRAIKRQESRQP